MPEDRSEDAWTVESVTHLTTGQTMGDEATGDEWSVEYTNPHYPHARVITTYAVTKRPTDDDGNWLDTSEIPDEDAHEHWRYAVGESTELLTTTMPEDFWAGSVEQVHLEYGEGSYVDFGSEEAADLACAAMATSLRTMTGVITWNGQD